jgi:16S rRNA (uracil1498-N3)-methyltransferase
VQTGEQVTLLDGHGAELLARVTHVDKREVRLQLVEQRRHPAPATELTLLQAIAKNAAMDGLIHRAVELGCRRIVPLLADRSVSRPDDAESKRAKWQTIADEALKQSGNPWRLTVETPVSLTAWATQREQFELLLIASLHDAPQHPRAHFEAFKAAHHRAPRSVGIAVGPEGDFSPAEYATFRIAGAKSLTLGPLVLRVETAATALLAVVQHELNAPTR